MEFQGSIDLRIEREKEIVRAKYWNCIYSVQDLLLEKGADVLGFLENCAWSLLDLIEHISRQPPKEYVVLLISELTERFQNFHTNLRKYQTEEIRHLGYQLISLARRLPYIHSSEESASFLRIIKEVITRIKELKASTIPAAVPEAADPEQHLHLPANMDDILIAFDILEAKEGDLREGLRNVVDKCIEFVMHVRKMVEDERKDDLNFITHFKKGIDIASSLSKSIEKKIDGRINESKYLKTIMVGIMLTMLNFFQSLDMNSLARMWKVDFDIEEFNNQLDVLTKKLLCKYEDIQTCLTQGIQIKERIKVNYLDQDVTEQLGRLRMFKEE